jgi:DNA helicase II / ATP-dependent DNA helicase PcrA
MDSGLNSKKVLNAVAGSGKTSYIINQLSNDNKRILVITYTKANQENLREKVIEKFGNIPNNIFIFGYFEFLLRFIIKPLCPYAVKDICFEIPHFRNRNPFTKDKKMIYANKMAKYILERIPDFKQRINTYFDEVFIDEMQDLASDDFMWMLSLANLEVPVTLVGDFFQSTFSSSRRGNHLSNLYNDLNLYKSKIEEAGYHFDKTTLVYSHRCTPTVCEFVKNKVGIDIESAKTTPSEIGLITNQEEMKNTMENNGIKKLFYQNSKQYTVNSENWGNSKGITFEHVCVVLNETTYKLYEKNRLMDLASITKSKFYVACTRTKGDLRFIRERDIPVDYKL